MQRTLPNSMLAEIAPFNDDMWFDFFWVNLPPNQHFVLQRLHTTSEKKPEKVSYIPHEYNG